MDAFDEAVWEMELAGFERASRPVVISEREDTLEEM